MRKSSLRILVTVFCVAAVAAMAQDQRGGGRPEGGRPEGGRGGFDPAQMQQRMLERTQEVLGASPEEWEVIKPRLTAVWDTQRAARELSGMRGMMRGGPQPREAVPAVENLEKAIEMGEATAITDALGALRKARAEREAEVLKAKEALREVLSVRQEARLVLMGTLD